MTPVGHDGQGEVTADLNPGTRRPALARPPTRRPARAGLTARRPHAEHVGPAPAIASLCTVRRVERAQGLPRATPGFGARASVLRDLEECARIPAPEEHDRAQRDHPEDGRGDLVRGGPRRGERDEQT
jgi:hypothetical protein